MVNKKFAGSNPVSAIKVRPCVCKQLESLKVEIRDVKTFCNSV